MLSYRHGFHAGNFADLLKHLVLVQIIEYLKLKPAPIRYVDTHSGAGVYNLNSEMSRKTGEFSAGVGSLDLSSLPLEAAVYAEVLRPYLASHRYPGSPLIAARLLREQDELRLYEMHPRDHASLAALFQKDKRVRVFNSDGFEAVKVQLPVQKARALTLIDPSYELDTDYRRVVATVKEGLRRMPHGVFAVWYPIVAPDLLQPMLKKLETLGGEKCLRIELHLPRSDSDKGMTAAGMLVANGPWMLAESVQGPLQAAAEQLQGRVVVNLGKLST